jgi:NAD(P)-dependent dehydrogenase (short-subunit alcohol dehydrogenase family)
MPSLTAASSHNAGVSLATKLALVVGGTSGIGQAVAVKLASMKASVVIAGRNAEKGAPILEQMRSINPDGTYTFAKADVSLLADVRRFAKEFQASHSSLDLLVITAGMMRLGGRQETSEGLDDKLATHYYGRALLINELMPLLEKSAAEGKDVRVVSVLAAAHGAPVDPDDLDLKKTYGLKLAADAGTFHNDLMVEVCVVPGVWAYEDLLSSRGSWCDY